MLITSSHDSASINLGNRLGFEVHVTDSFYSDGAFFNKWKALNEALRSKRDRCEWFAVVDADVVWPAKISKDFLEPGRLFVPRRRMCKSIECVPEEDSWDSFEISQEVDFAGYSQIFRSDDQKVNDFYEENWKHAGGADTEFQNRWDVSLRVRPPFTVLHLGEDGKNWCGRATPYRDGSVNDLASERAERLESIFRKRKKSRRNRYDHEKL